MTDPKTKPARRAKATAKPASETPRQQRAVRRQGGAPAAEGAPAPAIAADAAPGIPKTTPPAPKGPAGKLGVVVALMRRPEGATVAQMGEATGWQSHSVRGALAGSLKRKHKLTIVGEPGEAGRVYRIAAEQPA